MDHNNIWLTQHARDVMEQRNVTFQQIEEVLSNPDVVADSDRDGRKQKRYTRGEVTVITAPGKWPGQVAVITILWHVQQRWSSDQMRKRHE